MTNYMQRPPYRIPAKGQLRQSHFIDNASNVPIVAPLDTPRLCVFFCLQVINKPLIVRLLFPAQELSHD